VDDAGIVNLDLEPGSVADSIRSANLPGVSEGVVLAAAQVVERARYSNLYSLLRDHLNEEQYIEVVRNQILVDIQGGAQYNRPRLDQQYSGNIPCVLQF